MASRRADTDANMEPLTSDDAVAEKSVPRFNSPVCIRIDHYRYRLADPDGLSGKAAVDACVRAGLLADDSSAHVVEVRHRQHKIKKTEREHTTITMESVK